MEEGCGRGKDERGREGGTERLLETLVKGEVGEGGREGGVD